MVVEPSLNVTVTSVLANRSGSVWKNPSSGSKMMPPKSSESLAPSVPGLKVSVNDVSVAENFTSLGLSPFADPTWNAAGFATTNRFGADTSNLTDAIVPKVNGSTSRRK